jgi:hypothetical protein
VALSTEKNELRRSYLDSIGRVTLLAKMLFKDLLRRRVTLLLLFIVPALFDVLILVTTADQDVPVVFGILSDDIHIVNRRALAFVFLGVAAVGFLTSFLGFYLVFQRTETDRRLVLCGYRPEEIIISKLVVLTIIVAAIAVYEAAIILPFFEPQHIELMLLGLFLGGLIYGCYGLFIGSISIHELEGIFLIVLLANIDVGWLQNPSYFKDSANRTVIESLPGFLPTQLASLGAFTHEFSFEALAGSLLYASTFLLVAMFAFWIRVRIRRK